MRFPIATSPVPLLAVLALSAALVGCQEPDVGQKCNLDFTPDGGLSFDPDTSVGDFLETGQPECDNLVCVASAKGTDGKARGSKLCTGELCNPYCSRQCADDKQCFTKETGLVCRSVVLDEAFINSLSPELRQKYLGDIQGSRYCAVP